MIPLQFKNFPPNYTSRTKTQPEPLVELISKIQKTSIKTKLSFLSSRTTDPKPPSQNHTHPQKSTQPNSAFHPNALSNHNPNLLTLQPSTSKSSYLIPAFITLQKSRRQRKNFVLDHAPATAPQKNGPKNDQKIIKTSKAFSPKKFLEKFPKSLNTDGDCGQFDKKMVFNRETHRKFNSFDGKRRVSGVLGFGVGGNLAKSAARGNIGRFIGSENFVVDKVNLGGKGKTAGNFYGRDLGIHERLDSGFRSDEGVFEGSLSRDEH
jgi:hypothetical protein